MPQIEIYQVDAFTSRAFGGNSAAICPLDAFLDDATAQMIARENNLSETAYIVRRGDEGDVPVFDLRWFTPTTEVDICGHATLASAHVVLAHLAPDAPAVHFETRSGRLTVTRDGDRLTMDFPALPPKPVTTPEGLGAAMGAEPDMVLKSDRGDRDLLLVYPDEALVRGLNPDQAALKAFAPYGFIASAPGSGDADIVSRCFFPNHGIPEDPVTGSAHCVMVPYWAERLGKQTLFARQISQRGGELWLKDKGDRILITGQAVEVMRGALFLA
ncbi:MAG: PhzF family phenazine biosynthesis protein [Alphaproteobacteria bacterium]|nr:MAG: PhzF family phenazine biosynthesis protein [Alphaproteobacteria bacterium]